MDNDVWADPPDTNHKHRAYAGACGCIDGAGEAMIGAYPVSAKDAFEAMGMALEELRFCEAWPQRPPGICRRRIIIMQGPIG